MRDSLGIRQEATSSLSSNVRLKDLFVSVRLQDKHNVLKVILYFPFGFLLVVIRLITFIVGLLILSILPRTSTWSCIYKGLCRILGLTVSVDDKHLDDNAKLVIANHVSILDRLAINMVKPCNTVTKTFQIKNMDALSIWKDSDLQYYRELSDNELSAFQAFVENSSRPVLHFPEGATTSGKVGLLKFHPAAFSLNFIIQPVIVQVSLSSFITVSPTILGSNACTDILWPFFVPQIYYNLKVLPSMVKLPEESALDFSKRVQQTMAKAMGLIPTVYTSSDKSELIKRLRTSSSERADYPVTCNKENCTVADQYSQILLRSRELASKQKATLNTAAKSFGKSPKDRMLSYQERKTMLIEAARIKYLQKKKSFVNRQQSQVLAMYN